ncbi:Glutamine-dependent NAD(+) synthetase [Budvicia aquatica]|uniref:Glutamine-dependent NAD(+) synthetase n=1 Tax=Budvicia aquatica TaxID=82979 RepID=A0A484ZYG5_9GAMM|nr:Glutamine-dependent NAD(+) synthetase [Budvicia aquatica]
MSRALSIALAQLNWLVGDIEGNAQRMLHTINEQQQAGADIVMFSELALTGYPPEDLLYRDDLYQRCDEQLARLQAASSDIAIIVGHPFKQSGQIYNALSLFWQGNLVTRYYKQQLPNYGVFDEKRYFNADNKTRFIEFKDTD